MLISLPPFLRPHSNLLFLLRHSNETAFVNSISNLPATCQISWSSSSPYSLSFSNLSASQPVLPSWNSFFTQLLKQITARFSFSLTACLFQLCFLGHFPLCCIQMLNFSKTQCVDSCFLKLHFLYMILSSLVALNVIYMLMIFV